MGWDTEIIIIAESIESKESARSIGGQIFNKDSKRYGVESFFVARINLDYTLYYTYERRKYAPYWVIQEISKVFPTVSFTLLASSPDFLCGPAGIIKIRNNKIIDSYGIWGENSVRHQIIESPIASKKFIYSWYKNIGLEEKLRNKYVNEYPLGWCDERYSEKIIPIDDVQLKFQIENNKKENQQINWEEQPKFQLIPDFESYAKSLIETPQKELKITENSFLASIAHNPVIREVENKILNLLQRELFDINPIHLYDSSFGKYGQDRNFLDKKFNTIQDIEDSLMKNQDRIIDWAFKNISEEKNLRFIKGVSFLWLIKILKEIEN